MKIAYLFEGNVEHLAHHVEMLTGTNITGNNGTWNEDDGELIVDFTNVAMDHLHNYNCHILIPTFEDIFKILGRYLKEED